MTKTKDAMQAVANEIIDLMREHGTDWAKPWTSKGVAYNLVSGKSYRGMNSFYLGALACARGYDHNAWATFTQWSDKGAKVRKGEKASDIFFFSMIEKDNKETGKKERFGMWRYFKVFNVAQVEGYEMPNQEKQTDIVPVEFAEQFVKNTGAQIRKNDGRAFYHPALDYIGMPERDTFKSATGYYSTLLHELTHWTGHETRCKRDLENSFGSEKYAREELVAECGAALLCMSLGVEKQPTPEHAKYLNSWMQAIADDYKAIYSAMSQAQKAVDYLEGLQAEQAVAAE